MAHNLGVTPELVMIKKRDNTSAWYVGRPSISEYMYLNDTFASTPDNGTYRIFNYITPWANSNTFTL